MKIDKLEIKLFELKYELLKVEHNNDSAAIRARKLLQDIRLECKNLRDEIQEFRHRERI